MPHPPALDQNRKRLPAASPSLSISQPNALEVCSCLNPSLLAVMSLTQTHYPIIVVIARGFTYRLKNC